MDKKLNAEVLEILRDVLPKAKKDLGFIKEQKQSEASAFSEPFDVKKHMPAIEIKPQSWGMKGTTDSKQLDAVLRNIIPSGEKDGLKRFKVAMQNMNTALGTKFSKGGKGDFQPAEEGEQSSINEIISSLMVKNIINGLINESSPSAAGKNFEGFIARIAGGFSHGGESDKIEDLVDAAGNYISLKTVLSTTKIKGSKEGLARGILESPNNKVIYLICVKDVDPDPFKMYAYSFEVTENNFFNFIIGKKNPTAEDIKKESDKIFKQIVVAGDKESEKSDSSESLKEAVNIDKAILSHYKTDDLSSARDQLKKDFERTLKPAESLSVRHIKLLNALISRSGAYLDIQGPSTLVNDFISKMIVGGKVGEKITKGIFTNLFNVFPNAISEYSANDTKKLLNLGDLYPDVISKQEVDEIIKHYDLIDNAKNKIEKSKINVEYNQKGLPAKEKQLKAAINKDFEEIKKSFGDFINLLISLEKETSQETVIAKGKTLTPDMQAAISRREAGYTTPTGASDAERARSEFFQKLRSSVFETLESLNEEKSSTTQFEFSQATIKSIMLETANFDESFPTIIISKDSLFTSAQSNAAAFKNWAEPIYKGMHELTQGINQYFVEDLPGGLDVANTGVKEVSANINKLPKEKASKLTSDKKVNENKKLSLFDDILSDLLK